jgi:hypothetical protein
VIEKYMHEFFEITYVNRTAFWGEVFLSVFGKASMKAFMP